MRFKQYLLHFQMYAVENFPFFVEVTNSIIISRIKKKAIILPNELLYKIKNISNDSLYKIKNISNALLYYIKKTYKQRINVHLFILLLQYNKTQAK